MLLIVLTSATPLENEGDAINGLFDAGLEILHLRKPTFSIDEYRRLLHQIDSKHHPKIMIHQFPELAKEFTLRGIHLQEQARLNLGNSLNQEVQEYKNKGFSVTSSFHSKKDISDCDTDFEYVLLSPVFSSISKAGYEGKGFDVKDMDAVVIGMGGINEHTLEATMDLGYKGVGVLGGVWNGEHPISSFMAIRNKMKIIVQD